MTVALLAVAGFAAFSPEPATEQTAPTTTTTTTLAVRGSATGQVLARALAAGMRSGPVRTVSSEAAQENDVLNSLRVERYIAPPRTTTTAPPVATTTPAAAPAAKSSDTFMSADEVRSIISLFFKPADVDTALTIAKCESTLNPNNVNSSSHASGLFQHLPRYWAERSAKAGWEGADIFDPYANVAVAAWLKYYDGGWTHWTCYKG